MVEMEEMAWSVQKVKEITSHFFKIPNACPFCKIILLYHQLEKS
ncbi:hypothetical protein HBZC1_15410 [Helicobacter bizzozeronii CIII-1]|uniref:Uncharacterized protein n=1 Tax=Helicobacter bizzozeronii (strain CIII-1) TaxID=1002804 RepID=F8KP22_HELBC|nr:hypothetical protein HBZC1_15410 [Helicobacter bizzozeronii CIII-1]